MKDDSPSSVCIHPPSELLISNIGDKTLNAGHQVQVLSSQDNVHLACQKSDKETNNSYSSAQTSRPTLPSYLVRDRGNLQFSITANSIMDHFLNKLLVDYLSEQTENTGIFIHNVCLASLIFDRWLVHGTLKHGNALITAP
jgi:hypothetical protein